jgi:all-trans-retinol 13,14-reductase
MSQAATPSNWDAIVIGSGIGGMTAATLLAMARKRVLILERHTVPGGFSHTFKRRGLEWDVGVHYVGQMQDGSMLRRVFDYVTNRELNWSPLGDVYDVARINGKHYSFYSDFERHQRELISRFPEDETAIRSYFALIRKAAATGGYFIGEKTMPMWLSRTLGKLLRFRFESYARKTTAEVLSSITANAELRAVLCTQCGDYGLSPEKSSFAIHAVVVQHYLGGASYPIGGARSIPDSILKVFRANGGVIKTTSDVHEILVENNRACGVRLASGETHFAKAVISNAGFRNTFTRLVSPDRLNAKSREQIQKTLSEIKPSVAHLCLYVALKGSAEELRLPKNNIWVFDELTLTEAAKKSLTYISFPSAKDPQWNAAHPGTATVQVVRAADFEEVQKWSQEKWPRKSDDYAALKKIWSEELLAKLLLELPHLEGKIAFTELSTPLSTRHFSNYERGEIYGLEHTPARFASRWLRPTSPLKGLYLTGQDIVTVGVGGALYSGVLAATVILKKSVILRILFGRQL